MDASRIKPAPLPHSLLLINNFVINTTRFLNSFSENVEKKLLGVSRRITEVEITLSFLEAKLNSIPELDHIKPDNSASQPTTNIPEGNANNASSSSTTSSVASTSSSTATTTTTAPSETPTAPISSTIEAAVPSIPQDDGMIAASEHPAYSPFLKMLRVGVPPPVVVGKLQAAGLDPSVVDDPEKRIPK